MNCNYLAPNAQWRVLQESPLSAMQSAVKKSVAASVCRTERDRPAQWEDLPPEVLSRIFMHVGDNYGLKDMLLMRSVSKSAQAAVTDGVTKAQSLFKLSSLRGFSRLLPNLKALQLSTGVIPVNLWELGSCTQLTSLQLSEYQHSSGEHYDFSGLPGSLRQLTLNSCHISSSAFQMKENNIEVLSFVEMPATMCKDLHHMPNLKVCPNFLWIFTGIESDITEGLNAMISAVSIP